MGQKGFADFMPKKGKLIDALIIVVIGLSVIIRIL
jgi:hypothetical protein